MKRLLLSVLAIVFTLCSEANVILNFQFASKKEAQKYILEPDNYTKGWSQFDIDARLGKVGGTRNELQNLQQQECLDFTERDKKLLSLSFHTLEKFMTAQGLNVPAPKDIILVKTTMHEEGDAGAYTRDNKIYVGQSLLEHCDLNSLMNIMAHELFHVFTRNSIPFKRAVYTTIGFTVIDNEVQFPEYILAHRISNPDVNRYDSYAFFKINGKVVPCTMINYHKKDYSGGSFFDYLEVGLVELDAQHQPVISDGQPVIYSIKDATDFDQQLGKNTSYVINPEECLADNFALVATLSDQSSQYDKPIPNPELLNRIRAVLAQAW